MREPPAAPARSLPPPEALRRLVGLRYAMVGLFAVALLAIAMTSDTPHGLTPAFVSLAGLLVVNGVLHRRIARCRGVSEGELHANFVAEIIGLTVLLYFAGTSASPLASLYLLPLTMAANLLPRRHSWQVAVLAMIGYSSLLASYGPLGTIENDPHAHGSEFGWHLLGMWLIFILSAGLVAHYVSLLAQAVRERDRQLALAREEALRNERIVALGTLGAGAAHELGTPLATMSVLAEDMAYRHSESNELAADIADLQTEISRCKRILGALTEAAGVVRGEAGTAMAADRFLERVLDQWLVMRPSVDASLTWAGETPGPAIIADRTLEQALINLIDNAADASPRGFAIAGRCEGDAIVIDILDHGPGLTPELQARVGDLFFSTKASEDGMGIGLFLANATIERFGGKVHLFNRSGGGACTRIVLPRLAGAAAPVAS